MRRFLLSPAAEQDLEEIEAYIATENPSAVEGVLDSLEAGCQLVADHPGVGRDRDEIENGVLSFPIGSYVLFYSPLDADTVGIARILHGSRDLPTAYHGV